MKNSITPNTEKHLISAKDSPARALELLNSLGRDAILFIVDEKRCLIGSLTDGDIRRGLIRGLGLESDLRDFTQLDPIYIEEDNIDLVKLKNWRDKNFRIFPIVDSDLKVVDVMNVRLTKSLLPLQALIMAGGLGSRLRPLTDDTPKPMLIVGNKPIVEHNIDRLKYFGVNEFHLSIKYLGEKIEGYFEDGKSKNISIKYLTEKDRRGTIGAASMIAESIGDYLLVMNSDILTNIDYEDMFLTMIEADSDFIVATVPYEVKIPYGVVETEDNRIVRLKEKPSYVYYSNAGIYMMKKECVSLIPKEAHYNATDLIEELIRMDKKVTNYPIIGYWLDIGKHQDYKKANQDFDSIEFN